MKVDEFKRFSPVFDEGVLSLLDARASVNAKDIVGGTAFRQVKAEIEKIKQEEGF